MTDIVERLRMADEYKEVFDHLNRPYGLIKSLEYEAADEIEKLRDTLRQIKDQEPDRQAWSVGIARKALGEKE